ncbi:MAG: vacuolar iron transporter family protein [Thermoplasmata archaeon]|jgi:VIT1/CCC1 family predicted Fe2+/Mn2+ transporter|nr:vacuolar iron transporter family protein [Thermoplasmata archaeon]
MRPATGIGHYLSDLVYGALDGAVTTFAIAAGAAGADLGTHIILILGLANLVADGISMAASSYMAIRSEKEQAGKEPGVGSPMRHAAATFAAFAIVGAVPLSAFFLPGDPWPWAVGLTGAALFGVGAARSHFMPGRRPVALGVEMLAVGALASLAALGVGWLARRIL